jgi:hypothetical protein
MPCSDNASGFSSGLGAGADGEEKQDTFSLDFYFCVRWTGVVRWSALPADPTEGIGADR